LFASQQLIQHQLTFVISKGREELSQAHAEHAKQVVEARKRWMKEKMNHDLKCIQTLLPSKLRQQPLGTERIKEFMENANQIEHRSVVGLCLADVIDGSLKIAEGKVSLDKFVDFKPPPAPGIDPETGEDMITRQHRVESEFRSKYNIVNARFQTSENERLRAFKKMMKSKAELGLMHEQIFPNQSYPRSFLVTNDNYNTIPLPPLRTSSQMNIPREFQRTKISVASYTPPTATATATSGESDSKYSAAKIRDRKGADGTVAPVSEPKKTKEGFYMRPAGRTRKGMRWDPVAGVWVPQGQ
jgi:hypothetical protein